MVFTGLLAAYRYTPNWERRPRQALDWGLQSTRVSMSWCVLVKRSKNENTNLK